MCTGAEIASIAGTAASVASQQGARSAQIREAERGAASARDTSNRASARVAQEVNNLQDSTDDAGAADEAKLQSDFMAALRRSQLEGGGSGALSDAESGAVSDTFRQDAARARVANVAGNRSAATSAARIDAPFMQRVREAAGSSRAASDLSRISNEGAGQDFLSQLRMSMIQPNAVLSSGGQFLQGWGSAAAQRAPRPKPKPGTVAQYGTPSYTPRNDGATKGP